MAGNGDQPSFSVWYWAFLQKTKQNVQDRFSAFVEIRLDVTKKMDMLLKEMDEIDKKLAECDKADERKSTGKRPQVGCNNCDSAIQVDSDSDEKPIRMRRIVRFKGESSKSRGEASKGKEVLGVGVEGGEADMEISDEDAEVKEVIHSTAVVQAEQVQQKPEIAEENANLVQQRQQQPGPDQGRDSEEKEDEDEGNEQFEDSWYDNSEEDIGYPYHYHSPEVSQSDSGAYGFNSD